MTELRTHPTDETLRDFLLGKLPDADSPELETHLADCPDCQARTADGCAADTFVDLLTSARTRMAEGRREWADETSTALVTPSYSQTRVWTDGDPA